MTSIMQTINEHIVSVVEYMASMGQDMKVQLGDDVFVLTIRKEEPSE